VHHHRHDEPQPRCDRHGGHGQPGTAQYVAALAHHTYDFPSDATLAQTPTMAGKAGKPTSATEICCWNSSTPAYWAQYDPTITGALTMASIMFRGFTVSDDSAFQWWTALSKVMGCSPASSSSCATTGNSKIYNDGLILYLTNGSTRSASTAHSCAPDPYATP
jgi:hypothetical protein